MCVYMGDLGLQSHPNNFCRVCTEFDSGEILGWAQSLEGNVLDHAKLWILRVSTLHLLCTTDSPYSFCIRHKLMKAVF